MVTIDYQGLAILFGAIASFIVTVGGFGMQVATFVRAGRLINHQEIMSSDVRKIEIATNSMKDALIKTTREQSLLEGAAVERTEEAARKSLLAQGALKSASVPQTIKP